MRGLSVNLFGEWLILGDWKLLFTLLILYMYVYTRDGFTNYADRGPFIRLTSWCFVHVTYNNLIQRTPTLVQNKLQKMSYLRCWNQLMVNCFRVKLRKLKLSNNAVSRRTFSAEESWQCGINWLSRNERQLLQNFDIKNCVIFLKLSSCSYYSLK